jgi:hypothetical protein
MRRFSEQLQGVVALDGKTLRRLFDRAAGKSPLHLASARAIEQRLVMGQIAVDDESNEITASPTRSPPVQRDHRQSNKITAVPKRLELLALKGSIVTADALFIKWRSR